MRRSLFRPNGAHFPYVSRSICILTISVPSRRDSESDSVLVVLLRRCRRGILLGLLRGHLKPDEKRENAGLLGSSQAGRELRAAK